MRYNEHMGLIYDTIYYGVIYFNKQSVIKRFEEQFNLDEAFNYYDEVNNSCNPLESCLLPFFYYDALTPSFLSEHFRISLNFHKDKFQNFITVLKNTLNISIFEHLFANLSKSEIKLIINKDSDTVNQIFKSLTWSMEMKNQTMFLIYNFNYVFDLLIKTLIKLYSHITALHEKYRYKITQKIAEMESNETLILFKKLYSFNEKKLSRQTFSTVFMNPFVILEKQDGYKDSVFLLGYRYKEMLEVICSKKTIVLKNALFFLGEPIRFEIIMSITKYGSLTISELSRINDISKSTAYRSVNTLLEERILIESHRERGKIYYKVNNDYLLSVENLFKKFINESIKGYKNE